MQSGVDYLNAANDSSLLNIESHQTALVLPQYPSQLNIDFRAACPISYKLFYEILERMLAKERHRLALSEITAQTYVMLECRLNGHLYAYFGHQKIQQINYQSIQKFVEYLQDNQIGAVTINQYLGLLKRVLTFAASEGMLNSIPQFPKIKSKSAPRGSFTVSEYKQILATARNLSTIHAPVKPPTHRNTAGGIYTKTNGVSLEMRWLIGFMVNTFVRPVDIKLIKNKHIQIVAGSSQYLRIAMSETKRHTGVIVSMRAAVVIYRKLLKYQKSRELGGPENYVFFPELNDRQAAIQLISDHFRKILDASDMRMGVNGEHRTLYSLRHTAITFRLLYGKGIDLLTLARNARTSVEMIERFYSSNLTPEMNIELIQSKRTFVRN